MKCLLQKAVSGFFYLETADGVFEAKARGVLKRDGMSPVAGDWVEATFENEQLVIHEIYPRKNFFVRPPMANIDKLFIVSSQSTPKPNALLIDRLIAIAEMKEMQPILVFNKSDLGDFDADVLDAYQKSGITFYVISCKDNLGIDSLRQEIKGAVSAFVGNSGVGKSTLLNSIIGQYRQHTGDVSQKLGRGRHTTRQVELVKLGDNTYIADTPGFSTLDMQAYETFYKENLPRGFREFAPFVGNCRFATCTHTTEPGCAVLSAVQNGIIGKSRHDSYISIFDEVKNLQPWQIKKKKK
ncbi:MAG: ribosome small subunit-dependent GTPase A [Clostridia bacterium]|nr:ribosome small subunit-dependent GTPase A [Clostridia bacterium]MBQ7289079.1 ribosome small subunit-dependent GTPase A [Clostridia bacterium]